MGNYMTISLRADERTAIKERMEKYSMKQHEKLSNWRSVDSSFLMNRRIFL